MVNDYRGEHGGTGLPTAYDTQLSERLITPPAAPVDVVVAVFTFALVHCASAAAHEHLATSAPLTVAARVVKCFRRRTTVVTLGPPIG